MNSIREVLGGFSQSLTRWPLNAGDRHITNVRSSSYATPWDVTTNWPTGVALEDLDRLLGVASTSKLAGRSAMYVCAECGDLGCGALTAVIEVARKGSLARLRILERLRAVRPELRNRWRRPVHL